MPWRLRKRYQMRERRKRRKNDRCGTFQIRTLPLRRWCPKLSHRAHRGLLPFLQDATSNALVLSPVLARPGIIRAKAAIPTFFARQERCGARGTLPRIGPFKACASRDGDRAFFGGRRDGHAFLHDEFDRSSGSRE